MRLFIAIDISDDTRAEVQRVRAALEQRMAGLRHPPRMTWVAEANAHVTLRFLGEVPEPVGDRVRSALGAPFALRPFDIAWTSAGTFPGGTHPRIVWIGGDEPEAASALAEAVNARLEPIVGPGEDRPFRPHITIGRVKEPGSKFDWKEALAAIEVHRTSGLVDHVTLYQSRTSPKGPTYTPLAVAQLTSA
jgi:RNA 2',3'-cyclic 3'-phosphodiesterase